VEDVAEAYAESWRRGIKAVAIYRDGSKGTQPLNTSMDAKREPSLWTWRQPRARPTVCRPGRRRVRPEGPGSQDRRKARGHRQVGHRVLRRFQKSLQEIARAAAVPLLQPTSHWTPHRRQPRPPHRTQRPARAIRHRLPDERASITHKFPSPATRATSRSALPHRAAWRNLHQDGQGGFHGLRSNGRLRHLHLARLQHGVPLKVLCEKFAHTRFEPSGWTGNEQIGYAKSLMDYIFRWLNLRFLSGTQLSLFAGLARRRRNCRLASLIPDAESEEEPFTQNHLARLAEELPGA